MISSISNFPSIPSLQNLSLSNNNIQDFSSFINSIKIKFPHLRSLNTFKNPMNPGMMNVNGYNQYKMYIKKIGTITELDGMNINDNSFMNQGQQNSQPKRDLFGTSGTANQTKKVDFFGNSSNNNNNAFDPATQAQKQNIFTSSNVNMTQAQPQKKKMGMFDNMPSQAKNTLSQSTMPFTQNSQVSYGTNANNGKVMQRQFFVIDESEELDGSEFVKSKKKKSTIMFNEKIYKKSDNMTNYNRKNRSEGNKHITNKEL